TAAVSAIKPVFALLHEEMMIFALGFPVPWFRMKFQPGVLLLAPALKKFLRNRIGEAEGDKVRCLWLLAVGQVAASLNDLAIRIESAERDGASRMLVRRNRLEACVTFVLRA